MYDNAASYYLDGKSGIDNREKDKESSFRQCGSCYDELNVHFAKENKHIITCIHTFSLCYLVVKLLLHPGSVQWYLRLLLTGGVGW